MKSSRTYIFRFAKLSNIPFMKVLVDLSLSSISPWSALRQTCTLNMVWQLSLGGPMMVLCLEMPCGGQSLCS